MVLKSHKIRRKNINNNIKKDSTNKIEKDYIKNFGPKTYRMQFKSKNVRIKGYYNILIFLILVITDRISKIGILALGDKDYGIIALTYVKNTGAGFSILPNMNLLLILISILALLAIIYFNKQIPRFSVLTIISGIVGNLTDRIYHGGVIDFINLKFWPIFNIADSLICIGVIYWIIQIFREENKS
ncbi:MAG: signal peptidase II [Candidatus Woesearchaeota archaeon]